MIFCQNATGCISKFRFTLKINQLNEFNDTKKSLTIKMELSITSYIEGENKGY